MRDEAIDALVAVRDELARPVEEAVSGVTSERRRVALLVGLTTVALIVVIGLHPVSTDRIAAGYVLALAAIGLAAVTRVLAAELVARPRLAFRARARAQARAGDAAVGARPHRARDHARRRERRQPAHPSPAGAARCRNGATRHRPRPASGSCPRRTRRPRPGSSCGPTAPRRPTGTRAGCRSDACETSSTSWSGSDGAAGGSRPRRRRARRARARDRRQARRARADPRRDALRRARAARGLPRPREDARCAIVRAGDVASFLAHPMPPSADRHSGRLSRMAWYSPASTI